MAKEFKRKPLVDNIADINLHDSDPQQIGPKLIKGTDAAGEHYTSGTAHEQDTSSTANASVPSQTQHPSSTDHTAETNQTDGTVITPRNSGASDTDNTSHTSEHRANTRKISSLTKGRPAKRTAEKIERFKKTISFQQKYIDFIEYYKHDLRISDSNEFLEKIIDFYAEKKKMPFNF